MKQFRYTLLIVVLLGFSLTACGNTHSSEHMMNGTAMPMDGMDGMMPMSQIDDLLFLDGMIVHHQGAVDMANEALEQAQRPEVRLLAQNIVAAQTSEIAELQAWRDAWFPDAPATPAETMSGMDMGAMVTSQDSSVEYDIRFAQAMISHHRGALHMAQMLKTSTERPALQAFADRVIADQTAEIEQMEAWLAAWK